jgi:hypothetical protein
MAISTPMRESIPKFEFGPDTTNRYARWIGSVGLISIHPIGSEHVYEVLGGLGTGVSVAIGVLEGAGVAVKVVVGSGVYVGCGVGDAAAIVPAT